MNLWVPIPLRAWTVARDPLERATVMELYRLAFEAGWAAVRLSRREVEALGGLGHTRAEILLERLEAAGLISTSRDQAKGRGAARTLTIACPIDRAGPFADQPADLSADHSHNRPRAASGCVVDQPADLSADHSPTIPARPAAFLERDTPIPPPPPLKGGPPSPTDPAERGRRLKTVNPAAAGSLEALTLTPGAIGRLRLAGLERISDLERLSPQALGRLDGIGAGTIRAVRRAMADLGLNMAPDEPQEAPAARPAGPRADPRTRIAAKAWAEAHLAVFGRPWLAWDYTPRGDPPQLVRIADVFGLKPDDPAGYQLLVTGIKGYLNAVKAGRAWPRGEPPAIRHLAHQASDWRAALEAPAGHSHGGGSRNTPHDAPTSSPSDWLDLDLEN